MERHTPVRPFQTRWAWTLGVGLFTTGLAAVAVALPFIESASQGGLVGWLLLLAGGTEFLLVVQRGTDAVGWKAIVPSLLTALAGLLFVAHPLASYLPVANIVTGWLLLRGAWVLVTAAQDRASRKNAWLMLSGAVDMLLGMLLAAVLPASILVVTLFGVTREIVETFSLVLAISLLVTGVSQIALSLIQRRGAP